MSDLYCAATIVVARHAEAAYESDAASDPGGSLTLAGRDQALALARSLLHRKIAAIWCSDMSRAVQTAEIAAATLGLPVRVRSGLREYSGAETGSDVVRRVEEELQSIADEYRGETVLAVSHGGTIELTLPRLATNVSADLGNGRPIDNVGTCELAVDADGWLLRTWNGTPVEELAG